MKLYGVLFWPTASPSVLPIPVLLMVYLALSPAASEGNFCQKETNCKDWLKIL